jgi:hypothetical protein
MRIFCSSSTDEETINPKELLNIVDDIKSLKPLTRDQLRVIEAMPETSKYKLIVLYNISIDKINNNAIMSSKKVRSRF